MYLSNIVNKKFFRNYLFTLTSIVVFLVSFFYFVVYPASAFVIENVVSNIDNERRPVSLMALATPLVDIENRSSLIIVGELLKKEYIETHSEVAPSVITKNTILVTEVIKGDVPTPSTVDIYTQGGEYYDDYYKEIVTLDVSHEANLVKGETYIVFITNFIDKRNAIFTKEERQSKTVISKASVTFGNRGVFTVEGDTIADINVPRGNFIEYIRRMNKSEI